MRWREALEPLGMERVAVVAPTGALRDVLALVADEGAVQFEGLRDGRDGTRTTRGQQPQRQQADALTGAVLARRAPDPEWCTRTGRADVLAGEAALEECAAGALARGSVSALVGWAPRDRLSALTGRVADVGGAVVPLPRPVGLQPPTLLAQSGAARSFAPLVETYATVPYADLNPSVLAGIGYVVMFGMMFADAGHGALLLVGALMIRRSSRPWLTRLRPVWLFVAGAGLTSMVFGALYGELFGPTRILSTLWLDPMTSPIELLVASLVVGGVFLAGAYALGSVNRYREGGWRRAAYAPSGLAGAALFAALVTIVGGLYIDAVWLVSVGALLGAAGLAVSYAGLLAAAGGGAAGSFEAAVELFDLVVRLGSNVVSFARLAAFGLTHAALGAVTWTATTALWSHGGLSTAGAALVFLAGNVVTFALEGLIAAIQALRLEYYELFSRVFDTEGVPFRPWHIPIDEEVPC